MSSCLQRVLRFHGIYTIGISKVLQRICAKTMTREKCGSDQLCAGAKARIESAIHASLCPNCSTKNENDGCVLLVDATKAFNALSRLLAL